MDDLLIKYLLGEATPEESAEVRRWLQADAANRQRYEQYKTIWEMGRRAANSEAGDSGSVDARKAWGQLAGRLGKKEAAELMEGNREKTAPGWLRLAAVMIGLLLLGAGGYKLLMDHRQVPPAGVVVGIRTQPAAGVMEVPRMLRSAGARRRIDTLPDGTVVTLNRGASLELIDGTAETGLTVRLRGEGFFLVRHHPSRPFVVQVGANRITVLGTSFEVNEEGDSTELVVETGAVMVGGSVAARDSMIVRAGEQLTVTARGKWKKVSNRDNLYGYYLGRPLVCDYTPLRRLVETMNRADDTPIVLGRPGLGDLPLTTVFRKESKDRIVEIVAMTFHLSIKRQGSAIVLQ